MAYRILIVDDEEDIVFMLSDLFQMKGYEVLAAHGGPEALTPTSCRALPPAGTTISSSPFQALSCWPGYRLICAGRNAARAAPG